MKLSKEQIAEAEKMLPNARKLIKDIRLAQKNLIQGVVMLREGLGKDDHVDIDEGVFEIGDAIADIEDDIFNFKDAFGFTQQRHG